MIVKCKDKEIFFNEECICYLSFFKKEIKINYCDIKNVEFKINIYRLKVDDMSKIVSLRIYTYDNKKYYCSINYDDNGKVESFLRSKNIKISKKFNESLPCDSYGD